MKEVNKKPYHIYFFEPGCDRYRLAEMSLDTPPQAIAVGDILDGRSWPKDNLGDRIPFFRVRAIAHQFIELSDHDVVQQLGVYLDQLTFDEYRALIIGSKFVPMPSLT
ncbi:MAG: hypothetical protein WC714_27735 [Candidatus Obscuribacterales bacterium]|jgi:hypothetical protein